MSLEHPLLGGLGVRHAFGTRSDAPRGDLVRPRQVHGNRVASAETCRSGVDADAVVVRRPIQSVARPPAIAIVTADCVPILAAASDGSAVAAIHAGWRGLAAGVVAAGIDALRREAGGAALFAAIGPHVGPCCYEVDGPVLDALRYFDTDFDAASRVSRPGHRWLDLGRLTRSALLRAGVSSANIGGFEDACTCCDAERFHSYRRDGPHSGRLVHWITVAERRSP